MRLDEQSIKYVSDFYQVTYSADTQFSAYTSTTEDYGCDVPLTTSRGPLHVEVKTKNRPFIDWGISTSGPNLCFALAPPIVKNIDKVSRLWVSKPTQQQIDEAKAKEPGSGERKRWFCLNAASGRDFEFSKEYPPKWLKMFKDPNSELVVVFSDGILRFTHDQLLDAQASYGYMKTNATEEYWNADKDDKYWQLKVFLDLDKGTFYSCEVPKEVVEKKRCRTNPSLSN